MKLIVSSDSTLMETFDTVVMDPIDFNHMFVHPYIATAGFTEVQIDLRDKISPAYVERLTRATLIRPIYKDFDLSQDAIILLSYIYPDKGAALRFNMIKDKEKLQSILKELAESFEWRKIQ